MARSISFPPRINTIVGMLRTLKRTDVLAATSVSTFANSARPRICLAAFANSGAIALHGPHHSAQKSTTRINSLLLAYCSKLASSNAIGPSGNSLVLHLPQIGSSGSRSSGTRFSAPQVGQTRFNYFPVVSWANRIPATSTPTPRSASTIPIQTSSGARNISRPPSRIMPNDNMRRRRRFLIMIFLSVLIVLLLVLRLPLCAMYRPSHKVAACKTHRTWRIEVLPNATSAPATGFRRRCSETPAFPDRHASPRRQYRAQDECLWS